MTTLEAISTKLVCQRCKHTIGIVTPECLYSKHKGREWQAFPGSTIVITCDCGERLRVTVPLRA